MSEALPAFQFYRETKLKEVELNGRKVRIPTEWGVVEFGEVAEKFIGGGTPSTKKPEYWNGDIPWITSAIISGYHITEGEKYITELGLRNSSTNIVPKGNLVVATRVGLGKAAITKIDVAINQDLTGVILKKNVIDPEYAVRFITSSFVVRFILASSRGTTIKGISRKELARIKLPLPPLQEQKQIAEVLRSIDEAIQAVDESIEKLERLKKGTMEQLLTRGINHTKFKTAELNGRKVEIPEEWEVVKSGDIISYIKGKKPKIITKEPKDGWLPYLSTEYLRNNNPTQFVKITGNEITVEDGDILLLWDGSNAGEFFLAKTGVLSSTMVKIFLKKDVYDPLFLFYLLKHREPFLKSQTKGTGIPHVDKNVLNALLLPLPPLPEQKKIAEILRTIDEAIEAKRQKKEKLERMKKAVMEKLLTGEVRVR